MSNEVNMKLDMIEEYVNECKHSVLSDDKILISKSKLLDMLCGLRMQYQSDKYSGSMIKDRRDCDVMLNLLSKDATVTATDIDLARVYLSRIPCREFVQVCGTGVGCSNCPHYHL